jgi:hypothetical protein
MLKMKEYNVERLAEMSYTMAIIGKSFTQLVSGDEQTQRTLQFIKKEWPKTLENYGQITLEELVRIEIQNFPIPRKQYSILSDSQKKEFWEKVKYYSDNV